MNDPIRVPRAAHLLIGTALVVASLAAAAQGGPPVAGQWPQYAGDNAATHYSALDQITPANVGRLKLIW